ncbi:MAG: hypothetical protein WC516_06915 [Patescibacteria group bacterium]|jgi:hypothetical protein
MGKAFGNRQKKYKLVPGDDYPTAYSLTELLFSNQKKIGIKFDCNKTVWEPAAGDGHMVKVLKDKFNHVVSSDISHGYMEYEKGKLKESDGGYFCDFLNVEHEINNVDYIITNPPFSLADEFILRAKKYDPEIICFLLRTNYLSGQSRGNKGIYDGLAHVAVFDRMPDFRAPIREDGKFPTAMNVYAWFIWRRGWKKKADFTTIKCGEFCLKSKEMSDSYRRGLYEIIGYPKRKVKI